MTMVAAMGFMVIASIAGFSQMNLLAAALAGGCLGFLVWNFHPAKVFMGDTGSLFLGGMVVALAFGLRRPLLLVFIGIVYRGGDPLGHHPDRHDVRADRQARLRDGADPPPF